MNVGLDITSLLYQRGVSRYTSNLLRSLNKIPDLSLYLYGNSFRKKEWLEQQAIELLPKNQAPRDSISRVKIQSLPAQLAEVLWNNLGLNPVSSQLPDLDVFHAWDWITPPDKKLKLVSTIHDLAILRHPETAKAEVLKMHRSSWKKLSEAQAQIIAVSQATRRDVLELLNFPADRVSVIYEALPKEFLELASSLSEEDIEEIKHKLEVTKPFLLFVGTREPRKNLLRIIEAWQPFAHDFELVVAGEQGWDGITSSTLGKSDLSRLKKLSKPRFLGKVTDKELVVLYSEAEVLLYPSISEGFGLPILEAFHFGTPVVTSSTSSMPEVAGNAAELVNPLDIDSISHGVQTILNENVDAQRHRLQRMILRGQLFSWDRAATQTAQIYRLANRS